MVDRGDTARTKILFLISIVFGLAAANVSARTWNIAPDGSGDAPTIQAGLDSSTAGDTVVVQSGTYYESGLHNLKSGVVLVSETGESDCATIDAQHEWDVIKCSKCDSSSIIKGFTLTHGQSSELEGPPGAGGGMKCLSSVRVVNCLFLDNLTYGYGGAVWVEASSPTFENCTFVDNSASQGSAIFVLSGASCTITGCTFVGNYSADCGTVYCNGSSPQIQGCTFYRNAAENRGSGISSRDFAAPDIDNTIMAFAAAGSAVDCDGWSHPVFRCCDIYGNADGDWDGYIASQNGVDGNFSADPLFCNASSGLLTVESCSPCLPGNHPSGYNCGATIGRWNSACDCGEATEPSTWGTIKAMHK